MPNPRKRYRATIKPPRRTPISFGRHTKASLFTEKRYDPKKGDCFALVELLSKFAEIAGETVQVSEGLWKKSPDTLETVKEVLFMRADVSDFEKFSDKDKRAFAWLKSVGESMALTDKTVSFDKCEALLNETNAAEVCELLHPRIISYIRTIVRFITASDKPSPKKTHFELKAYTAAEMLTFLQCFFDGSGLIDEPVKVYYLLYHL